MTGTKSKSLALLDHIKLKRTTSTIFIPTSSLLPATQQSHGSTTTTTTTTIRSIKSELVQVLSTMAEYAATTPDTLDLIEIGVYADTDTHDSRTTNNNAETETDTQREPRHATTTHGTARRNGADEQTLTPRSAGKDGTNVSDVVVLQDAEEVTCGLLLWRFPGEEFEVTEFPDEEPE